MDRFRGRIGRRGVDKREEVPRIVIDSPPEEINVPYADSSSPSTSGERIAPIAVPDEEPVVEVVVEEPQDDSKGNKSKESEDEEEEISKPESADPAGENANLLDDDDEEAPSDKKQRRASLRRNSISLPNLDSLELQDIKSRQARNVKGVSIFFVDSSMFITYHGIQNTYMSL